MRTLIKKFLWLTPFACFALGYVVPYLFFNVSTTTVPHLLGKPLHTALQEAAACNLSLKLLRTQEDETLPVGTILFQTPSPQRAIRPHQTILVVTSSEPQQHTAPDCTDMPQDAAVTLLKKEAIAYTIVPVPSDTLHATVLSQEPAAGTPLNQKKLTLYISNNQQELVLFPSCINLTVQHAYEFLTLHNLTLQAQHGCNQSLSCCQCIITEQKPLAGSYIDLKKPTTIHVHAKR